MVNVLGEALKVTLFGMAIVFVMLIVIILAVKVIEPVRKFFGRLFKRNKGENISKEDNNSLPSRPLEEVQAAPDKGVPAVLTQGASDAPDGSVVAAIIAAVEASSGMSSRQFVLRSIRRRPVRRGNNIF